MFPKKRPTFPAAWEADRLALRAAHLMRICCFSKKDFSRFFGICLTEEDHDETKNVKRVTYIQGSLLVSLWLSKPFPDYQRQLRFSNEFPKKKKKKKKSPTFGKMREFSAPACCKRSNPLGTMSPSTKTQNHLKK